MCRVRRKSLSELLHMVAGHDLAVGMVLVRH